MYVYNVHVYMEGCVIIQYYNFTCSISAHEYPDTKNIFKYKITSKYPNRKNIYCSPTFTVSRLVLFYLVNYN